MKVLAIILGLILLVLRLEVATAVEVAASELFKCKLACNLDEPSAICAFDSGGFPRTFRNECTMQTENCLQDLSFQKVDDKACY